MGDETFLRPDFFYFTKKDEHPTQNMVNRIDVQEVKGELVVLVRDDPNVVFASFQSLNGPSDMIPNLFWRRPE